MHTFIQRFFAVLMTFALMIPAVAISEETPTLTASINKMTFNAGDTIAITWEADPERTNTGDSYGVSFKLTNYSTHDARIDYIEEHRCQDQYSGIYYMTIPACLNGQFDLIIDCYPKDWNNDPLGHVEIVGITINGPEQAPELLDIQYSKPLENIAVGDTVEMVVGNGPIPEGIPAGMTFKSSVSNFTEDYALVKNISFYNYDAPEERKATLEFAKKAHYWVRSEQVYTRVDNAATGETTTIYVNRDDEIDLRYFGSNPTPTTAPTTAAPTVKPTTAPTDAPTTQPTSKPTTAPGEPVELNLDAITIGAKQSVSTVKVESGKNITWSSADEKIATVDANGKITGVKKGKTTITAASADGQSDSVEVTVVAKNKGVKKIKLNKKNATLKQGEKLTLAATLTPSNAKNKNIIWQSSDTSVVTVDAKGKVKAVGTGKATITAIASSGKTAKCEITVTGAKVKKITISGEKVMKKGATQTLTAKIKPVFAENQNLKWKSSNKKIATVDANGVVTALKKGTVTITATAKDGSKVKATFTIKVKK